MTGYQHIKYATKPADYRHIKYEVADKIARITLNRPDQANVQSTILLELAGLTTAEFAELEAEGVTSNIPAA